MSSPVRRATYQDVLDAPEHLVAEIVDGVLYTHSRPRARHAYASHMLAVHLEVTKGNGLPSSPKEWFFLPEPELHFADDVLVPDVGGWRKERFPENPNDIVFFEVAPDLVVETLSPSTARFDRVIKLSVYLRERVPHLWFVDPEARTVECLRLDGPGYRLDGVYSENDVVKVAPFDDVGIEISRLWFENR